MHQGPLIILSGPSGAGKSTVVHRLLEESGLPLRRAVTATTREKRKGEIEGVDYHFWSRERFLDEIAHDGLLEYAEVHGKDFYGTPWSEVLPYREQGVGVILVIDVQGAAVVRARCPEAVSIFLNAPLEVLEQRIRDRGSENDAAIRRRLESAHTEMARASEYHYHVENLDLSRAVAEVGDLLAPLFEAR